MTDYSEVMAGMIRRVNNLNDALTDKKWRKAITLAAGIGADMARLCGWIVNQEKKS